MVVTTSSMIGRIFPRGMRARARIESVWRVAVAMRASRRGSASSRNSPVPRASANKRPKARSVPSIASPTRLVKIRIGDGLGGGAQHREAAARTIRTAEVEIKRGGENARELRPQRLARRKQRRERLVHALPVLPVSLQIKRALVAEGAVQARPVQAGRGADVVERGGGETVAPKNVHRLRERRVGFEGARPATASRGGPRSGAHSFLYHVEQNS